MDGAISRRAVVAGVGGLAALHGLPAAAAAPVATVKLRLLETSDLHMFVYDYDYYASRQDNTVGLAKVSTLITAARAEVRHSLLFDNGDIIQGNPLGDYMALPGHLRPGNLKPGDGHPMFRAMNLLGYDAATFGNHEFNYGLDFLHAALRTARFGFVCANIETVDGKPFAPPTMVLTRRYIDEAGQPQTLRIGVIGFVTPQIMVWDRAKLEGRIRTVDIVDAARRHVPELRRQADVVVALCHAGIAAGARQGGEENASLHLAAVPGIDVIFTGHQHRVFPGPDYADIDGVDAVRGTLAGKPAVMPGFWGSHLGIIDLTLEKNAAGAWSVAGFKVEPRPIYRREGREAISLAAADPRLLAAVAVEHQATLRWMEQPVGNTTRPINTFFSLIGSDPSLSLVNAAQLWYARPLLAATPYNHLPVLSAAAPFKAGGTGPNSFVDIAAGPLDMKDIASLYMFANTVCAVRCSGAELREWLERSAAIFNRIDPQASGPQELVSARVPSYMFDVISGVTYAVDLTPPERYGPDDRVARPNAHRIIDLRRGGRPVDPAQEFIVVTNNYRADGGGGFPGTGADRIVLAAPDLNRDVIVRYVLAHKSITPAAEAVWRFAPLPRPVVLAFNGNADTAKHLGEHSGVIRLGEGADGYTRYGLTLG
ncbi:bifunctional 2',3'-cyclic-nucleotide 2'-phosphodiesterase/3'-nucleotidase [Lichenicoccus sp.]|uniref:bifunctional 2',3'-cyclic-nucleotide 2'-phosphodiesterase/3'-nucleotidase n=1 Tax=Lichenicoccus sp. TaxID=2781899 RepID=UPI003D12C0E4